ncbi:MAG: oligosaccharide flippase family protein [bacterium]|nr:oligosaccharide flippase family protein [bacterium]
MTSTASVAGIFAGMIRAKVMALLLGPAGIGIFSLLVSFANFVVQIAHLGTPAATTRYVSQARSENDKLSISKILTLILYTVLPCSILLTIICLLFSKQIALYLANDPTIIRILVIIISLSIPFNVLWLILDEIFLGYKEISLRARIIIANFTLSIIIIGPLIYFLKVEGLAIYHLLYMVMAAGLFGYYLRRILAREKISFIWRIDLRFAKEFYKFSLTTLATGLSLTLSLLITRSLIVRLVGLSETGLYQATISLATYLVMFQQSMQAYLYPHLSEAMEPNQFIDELNKGLRLMLLSMTPIIVTFILFSHYFVLLLYSREFLPITSLIPIACIGTYFNIIGMLFWTALLATRNLKVYSAIALVSNLLSIVLVIVLIPPLGLAGAIWAYTIGHLIAFGLYFLYLKKVFNYHLGASNIKLLISSLVIIGLSSVFYKLSLPVKILSLSIPLGWLYFSLTKPELLELAKIVKGIPEVIKRRF